MSAVTLFSVAQQAGKETVGTIAGIVIDKEENEPIPSASVRLLNHADSSYIRGAVTDHNGRFKLTATPNNYILEISFIGYRTAYQNIELSTKEPTISLGKIFLDQNAILLSAAEVTAKIPPILVKGDTIEYNSASYTPQENAMLQDLIKNIPGMEIDINGNITANGKPVQKILVDGKEFFGNDIAMALSNLPANMIKKLQLFKEESEMAKVTGFRDKNPPQVLNLVVKEELKQSIFGDVKAGYGSDDRYSNRGLVNYMRDGDQYSFIGDMSNVSNSDFMMGGSGGIDEVKNIGLNLYKQSSEKIKIGGNVRYNNNNNLLESRTNTQTFLPTGDRISRQNMSTDNNRESIGSNINLQWQPDSLTNIFASSYMNFNNMRNIQESDDISFLVDKDTTSGHSAIKTKGDGYNLNNTFTIGRRLSKSGRTVSMRLNYLLRKDNNNGTNKSLTTYSEGLPDKIIDQITRTENKTDNYGISLSYVEPLGKDYSLQLAYAYSGSNTSRDREALRMDDEGNYTIIDTAYTRYTQNKFINQNVSLNFQATKEKYSYNVGFSLDPTRSSSEISLGDSIIENLSQYVVNYSPTIHFSYNPNQNTNIDFDYSGSTSQPAVSQLSADTVVINALSKSYGNPNLKASYNNNVNVYYRKSNYETSRFLMLSGSFNYIFNNIVNYTKIDEVGNTVNTYRNIDGNMGANLNMMYDTPLRNKKLSINNTTYTSYYKNIGFSNGEKTITHNVILSQQATVKFKSKKIDTNLQASIAYNMARNNLTNAQDKNTTTYGLKHYFLINLPYDWSIKNYIEYSLFVGFGEDFKKNELLWNATLSKLFLKNKKGTLMLQCFDILNDRNNLSRVVSGNYISDSRINTINKYFMVSFSYRFNIFKGSKKQADKYDLED